MVALAYTVEQNSAAVAVLAQGSRAAVLVMLAILHPSAVELLW